MTTTPEHFGWIITVTALPSSDEDKERFGINLIRPAVFPLDLDDPRGPPVNPEDKTELGTLFFPWTWSHVEWHVFGEVVQNGAKKWKKIVAKTVTCETTGASSVCPSCGTLRDAIKDEITEASEKCEYPFSQDIRDFWDTDSKRSLVHSLAPLTHWPAVASGLVLQLTWVLEIEKGDLGGVDAVVCFPEFKFKVGSQERLTGVPNAPVENSQAGLQVATYPDLDQNPPDPRIFMGCEAARDFQGAGASNINSKPACIELRQGGLSRSALHGLVLSHLLPLRVLTEWIRRLVDLDIDPFKGDAARQPLRDALWKSLGTGREYAPACSNESDDVSEHAPFIVELLIPEELRGPNTNIGEPDIALAYRKALKCHSVTNGSKQFGEAIKFLAKDQSTSDRFTVARRVQWQLATEAWERLEKPTTNGEDVSLLNDWLLLADLLLSEEGACEFFGPWLDIVLAEKLSSLSGSAWTEIETILRKPGSIRLDMWQRVMAARVSDAQWAAIRDFGSEFDGDHNGLATATLNAVKDLLCLPDGIQSVSGTEGHALEKQVEEQAEQFAEQLSAQSSSARIRPKDRGIELHLESQSCGTDTDENIRGYAVALCGAINIGGGWFHDRERVQWITDTALWHTASGTGDWLTNGNGVIWMHDTIGTTEANGERVVSVEYTGLPLSATRASENCVVYDSDPDAEDRDGFKCVDFAWPWRDADDAGTGTRDLPLLAYGAYYRAVAVPIGNAGVPLSTAYVQDVKGAPYGLRPAKELDAFEGDWHAHQDFRYLSSRRPAAPRVVDGQDIAERLYELDEDTQTHAFQIWQDAKPDAMREPSHRVALIAGAEAQEWLRDGASSSECRFTITTPTTDADFFRRWLGMDRLVKKLQDSTDESHYSDDTFASSELSSGIMLQFEQATCGDRFAEHKDAVYDGSVSAIGVVVWNPSRHAIQQEVFDLDGMLTEIVSDGKAKRIERKNIEITFEVSAVDKSVDWSINKGNLKLTIKLPPSEFVRINVYSLVKESHFTADSPNQRFATGIKDDQAPLFKDYRAFGVLERWVEAMPSWDEKKVDISGIKLSAHAPGTNGNGEDTVSAHADFSSAPNAVHWIRDLYLQRHEWHWTGYPVRFPAENSQGSVENWLPPLAGVESYRASQTIRSGTSFKKEADDRYVWQLGRGNKETFFSRSLSSGPRPARFEGYFVRAVPRFRQWLKAGSDGPLGLESHTLAAAVMLPGRAVAVPDARLPPPVLRWAVPLTTTHDVAPDKDTIRRTSNGVMLVFDEALHRTDDLADVGGLGEVIEVDLLDTRDSAHPEIGVNPIFHPLESAQQDAASTSEETTTPRTKLDLVAGRPFGLTHDIGPNPKVAQTAIVVRPEQAGGRWIMAKVRTRRLILPETEFGVSLTLVGGAAAWPTRRIGEDVVPVDLAIDFPDAQSNVKLSLMVGNQGHVLIGSNHLNGDTRRLLLTWHKGRWGGGSEVFWSCQLLQQKLENADELIWRTLRKTSCHEVARGLDEFRYGTFIGEQLGLKFEDYDPERVSVLRCSDYTDPMWLTFIGSFERDSIGDPQDYRVKIENESLVLTSLRSEFPLPVFRNSSEVVDSFEVVRSLDYGRKASSFHIVLVYRQVPDVLKGRSGMAGGVLEQVFMAPNSVDEAQRKVEFNRLWSDDTGLGSGARQAYVFAVQADSGFLKLEENSFDELLNQLFPDPDEAESRLRILPEYLGPIDVSQVDV